MKYIVRIIAIDERKEMPLVTQSADAEAKLPDDWSGDQVIGCLTGMAESVAMSLRRKILDCQFTSLAKTKPTRKRKG